MSGTSFDGVDTALIRTDGYESVEVLCSNFIEYTNQEKNLYFSGIKNFNKLAKIIDNKHIIAIKKLIKVNSINSKIIDIIGLHGQTLMHNPKKGFTWQYIDAEKIKENLKIPVISDFRIKDVSLGGEGAPLVPLYHKILSRKKFNNSTLAIVNIGGISNVTIIQKNSKVIGFDIGPGNGPLDKISYQFFNKYFDKDGLHAMKGKVSIDTSNKILEKIKKIYKSKSYDRNLLDKICIETLSGLNGQDSLATLTYTISKMIYKKTLPYNTKKIILVGGGRKNLAIKKYLEMQKNIEVLTSDQIGWNGDSLEAEAFAYLAVRSLLGLNYTFNETTGVKKPCSGGVLSNL